MRFHLALAKALTGPSAKGGGAEVASETLGLSPAEFDLVTQRCRSALQARVSKIPGASPSQAREARDQALTSAFAEMLAQLSADAAARLRSYVNGPFRERVRMIPIRGGVK